MPYLIKDFARTTASQYAYNGTTVSHEFYGGPSGINGVIPEVTSLFYLDLKSMLQTTTLSITFEDETNSFFLFGIKFTVYCINANMTANDSFYSVIPVVYRNKDYSNRYPFTRAYYGSSNASYQYRGSTPQESICQNYSSRQNLAYRIRIHYNTNFLHISYGSRYNLNFIIPVMCAIKGLTVEGKDIVYLSGDPNTGTGVGDGTNVEYNWKYGVAGSANSVYSGNTYFSCYHSLVYPDKPDVCLTLGSNGVAEVRNNVNPWAIFENLKNTQYIKPRVLSDTNQAKFLKRKVVTVGNMIDFDNVLVADDIMTDNSYYDVAGDTYFCPGSTLSTELQYAYPNYYYQTNRILLKI